MSILRFYRTYCSILAGGIIYFFVYTHWWIWILATIIVRILWQAFDHYTLKLKIKRSFQIHESKFKELYGPYGIRIINKADSDWYIKKSLYEVFVENKKVLKEKVDQLQVMDTLFQAGFRPQGDEYLLHDLKLKYGRYRLEQSI